MLTTMLTPYYFKFPAVPVVNYLLLATTTITITTIITIITITTIAIVTTSITFTISTCCLLLLSAMPSLSKEARYIHDESEV